MKKLVAVLLLSFVAVFVSSCMSVPGMPQNAVVLGERSVAFGADHDVIQVGSNEGVFKSLFFVVEKNSIQIYNLVVTYGNGEKEKFDVRLDFSPDTHSRLLPLEGGKRHIRSISFTYKTIGSWLEGQARVVVYGVM